MLTQPPHGQIQHISFSILNISPMLWNSISIMTSDETENAVTQAMNMVKELIPSDAFYCNDAPMAFMIDDSQVEHAALLECWPSSTILLCIFHFLQKRWTWLYDG